MIEFVSKKMSSILISTNEDDGDEDTIGKGNGDDNNIMTA